MAAEDERRDDAEVAAAAAQGPVEVGVLVGRGADDLAARQDHLRLEQVVDGEAVGAAEVADAAAERKAADARGRDDAARRGEPVRVRSRIDGAPRGPTTDADGARLWVDLDAVQGGEVDHDAVVDDAQARAVVPSAADGDRQVMRPGEADDGGDRGRVGGARDQCGTAVDHRVEDRPLRVVRAVAGIGQLADEPGSERGSGRGCGGDGGAHLVSLVSWHDRSC